MFLSIYHDKSDIMTKQRTLFGISSADSSNPPPGRAVLLVRPKLQPEKDSSSFVIKVSNQCQCGCRTPVFVGHKITLAITTFLNTRHLCQG